MKRWLMLVLVLVPIALSAQAIPRITWEHDGIDVSRFECVVDGGTPVDLGLPVPSGTTYSTEVNACPPLLVNGTHSLVVQACNVSGCTAATAITVVKL